MGLLWNGQAHVLRLVVNDLLEFICYFESERDITVSFQIGVLNGLLERSKAI